MKALNSLIAAVFFLSPLLAIAQTPANTDTNKAATPTRSFVVIDKNKDGHISREEAKQAGISNLNFDAADKDKDGKINLSEWTLLKF
jgi:Ca2+-binding EF-hand superfamily protein